PLYEKLARHGDPLVQLWGRYLLLSVRRHHGQMPAAEAELAYQQVRQAALQIIEKYRPPSEPLPSVRSDLRHGCYSFLWQAGRLWRSRDAEARCQDQFAICNFMLRRRELVSHVFQQAVRKDQFAKDHYHDRRWGLIHEAQQLLTSGKASL